MATENLLTVNVSAAGKIPTPPLARYAFACLPAFDADPCILHYRALNEEGNALFEGQITVVSTWYKFSDLINSASPPSSSYPPYPPSGTSTSPPYPYGSLFDQTVAIEVIYIEGGYVYCNLGGNPSGSGLRAGDFPYFPTINTPPAKLSHTTMVMAGDILGPASYVRPIGRTSDSPGLVTKVVKNLQLPLASESEVYAPSTPSTNLRIPHGAASRLAARIRMTRNSSATDIKANYFYRYRQVEVGKGTFGDDTGLTMDWSAKVYLAQLFIAAGGSTNEVSTAIGFDSPSAGAYQFQFIAEKVSGSFSTNTGNEVVIYQEVYL